MLVYSYSLATCSLFYGNTFYGFLFVKLFFAKKKSCAMCIVHHCVCGRHFSFGFDVCVCAYLCACMSSQVQALHVQWQQIANLLAP